MKKNSDNVKNVEKMQDGFILLDSKEVPVDKLFKTTEEALDYIQEYGELMDILDSVPIPVYVTEISEKEFRGRRTNRFTVAMYFAFPGCGEGYGAGSMTLMDGDDDEEGNRHNLRFYEYEIIPTKD